MLSVSVVFKLLGFLTMVSNTEYRHRLRISHRWVTASSVLVLVTQCTLQSGGQSVLLPEVTALSPIVRVLDSI